MTGAQEGLFQGSSDLLRARTVAAPGRAQPAGPAAAPGAEPGSAPLLPGAAAEREPPGHGDAAEALWG